MTIDSDYKKYQRILTDERRKIAESALTKAESFIPKLNEVTQCLNQSWKNRKTKANNLIVSSSTYELLRQIAIAGLDTEELLESFRELMANISKYYNIAMTETAAILNDAIEAEDNMIYLEGRKLIEKLIYVATKFNGRKITGVRPEILIDTYAHYRADAAAVKYSSAKFLLNRLINIL